MKKIIYNLKRESGSADLSVLLSFFAFFLSVGVAFIYFSLYGDSRPANPPLILQRTFASASAIKSYSAHIKVQSGDAMQTIPSFEGNVLFDVTGRQSNAVFEIPVSLEKNAPKAMVQMISSGGKNFGKIQIEKSPSVFPEEWIEIISGEYAPEPFNQIENTNAFIDPLQSLREGKDLMKIVGEIKKEKVVGVETFHFELASNSSTVVNRHLNVWTDQKTGEVKQVRFSLEGYIVTATFSQINKAVQISVPSVFLSGKDWKGKQFALSLPKQPIDEVFIGSYGTLKKEYLDGVKSAIQKATGIKVTVMGSGTAIEKKTPLYNETRQQFDADALFAGIKATSEKYGATNHFIYVLDENLYSPADLNGVSVWSQEKLGSNTSLVSLYDLQKKSDTETAPASLPVVISRLQKISLHALGTSVGFSLSSSSDNKACVMYPATTLSELDAQGVGYCDPEKGLVSKVFKK